MKDEISYDVSNPLPTHGRLGEGWGEEGAKSWLCFVSLLQFLKGALLDRWK